MTISLRGISRTSAVAISASALALTLAACGGGSSPEASSSAAPASSSAAPTSEASTMEAGTAEATSSGAASSGAAPSEASSSQSATSEAASSDSSDGLKKMTKADVKPARQLVVDFYKKAGKGDYKGACKLGYDPTTKGSPSSDFISACAGALEGQKETLEQAGDLITMDSLSGKLKDGQVEVSFKGAGGGTALTVVRAADGKLYMKS